MNGNQKPGLIYLQILKTNMQGNVGGSIRRISIFTLTMTVLNTGMTDLEKRKRYLMDLLAEKLKSSKMSNFLLVSRLSMFPAVNKPENSKKERSFFFILFIFYFIYVFRSE